MLLPKNCLFISQGIYDIHIQLSGVPLLPWESPPLSSSKRACEFMSYPVYTLRPIEKVGYIIDLLKHTSFNGFPITIADDRQSQKQVCK